jgi:hypothetical protein
MTPGPDVKTVVSLLTDQLERLCADLVPTGRPVGPHWVDASRDRGGLGDSFKVCLRGGLRGQWKHYGAGDVGGDALDLVAYAAGWGPPFKSTECKRKAIEWAKRWLGLENADPATLAARREEAARQAARRQDEAMKQRAGDAKLARGLFLGALPELAGTPVDHYLRGRGIALERLARMPGALRFHPGLGYTMDPPERRRTFPAMVASIAAPGHGVVAVHLTFLAEREGRWAKAPVVPAKVVRGAYAWAGAAVSLARGAGDRPWPKMRADERVLITEGIEDGLTLALACPEHRVLAAVSLANMGNVWLADGCREVTIVPDNDGDNPHAREGLARAIAAHQAKGRRVLLAPPDPEFKDVNAMVMGAA